MATKYVILCRETYLDPINGVQLNYWALGPFETEGEASAYMEASPKNYDCSVIKLLSDEAAEADAQDLGL